ncbi:MAG: hypothetical protein LBR40_06230 [Bacilli bacterium]|jgi:hypothetical protein|nr:hypothetical protein [Bacilli bacterium]
MISLNNKWSLRLALDKLIFQASLCSYSIRVVIYTIILLVMYFSFSGLVGIFNGTTQFGTTYEMLREVFNIYSFSHFSNDYIMLIFIIESIIHVFISDKYKNEQLIYFVGREKKVNKQYFKYNLKLILKSSLMIYSIFILGCLVIIIGNFIVTKEIMIMNRHYFVTYFIDPPFDKFLIVHFYPQYFLFIIWIPAIINYIILFFMQILVNDIVKNKIMTLLFSVVIYLFIMIILININIMSNCPLDLHYFAPSLSIFNLISRYSQLYSWLNIGGLLIILIVMFTIKRRSNYNDF